MTTSDWPKSTAKEYTDVYDVYQRAFIRTTYTNDVYQLYYTTNSTVINEILLGREGPLSMCQVQYSIWAGTGPCFKQAGN